MEAAEGPPRRSRGFRGEDYHNNRRVFLRSYPLQWEGEEDYGAGLDQEEEEEEGKGGDAHVPFKRCLSLHNRLLAVVHWGEGKLVILRRSLKKKVTFYVAACQPFGFKPPGSRLSLKLN